MKKTHNNIKLDIMLPYGYSDMVDFTAYLGDDHKERVQLSLSMPNGVTYKSEKVTVNINRIEISATNHTQTLGTVHSINGMKDPRGAPSSAPAL